MGISRPLYPFDVLQMLAALAMRNSTTAGEAGVARGSSDGSRSLAHAPQADANGHCTWEALSLSSAGSWMPTTRRPSFDSTCPYMKERYKCAWDRSWQHVREWVPSIVHERRCSMLDGLRASGVAERLERRPNILLLGNSLIRELYETTVCEHQDEVSFNDVTDVMGCFSVSLSVCLLVCLSICLSVCLSVCLTDCPSVRPSVRPSVCLSIYPPQSLPLPHQSFPFLGFYVSVSV